MDFNTLIQQRRSHYEYAKSTISDQTLIQLTKDLLSTTPSAFHSQSQRIVLLLGEKHDTFWDLVLERLRYEVPEEKFPRTHAKIQGLKNGQGTFLFYDDTDVTKQMEERFPLYGESAQLWAYESNAMLQYATWLGLTQLGLGASLQHYNPLIDQVTQDAFQLPAQWKLIAMMPFGSAVDIAKTKISQPVEDRMILKK